MKRREANPDRVDSLVTFLEFLDALREERELDAEHEERTPSSPYGPTAAGWNNTSIDMFLDAMHAWAVDSDALTETPTWHDVAGLLYAGKIYE